MTQGEMLDSGPSAPLNDPLPWNTISGNTAYDTKTSAMYYTCPAANATYGPCPGGTLAIQAGANQMVIENNWLLALGLGTTSSTPTEMAYIGQSTAGLEIQASPSSNSANSLSGVSNLTAQYNYVYDTSATGGGIDINQNCSTTNSCDSNLIFANNFFYQNDQWNVPLSCPDDCPWKTEITNEWYLTTQDNEEQNNGNQPVIEPVASNLWAYSYFYYPGSPNNSATCSQPNPPWDTGNCYGAVPWTTTQPYVPYYLPTGTITAVPCTPTGPTTCTSPCTDGSTNGNCSPTCAVSGSNCWALISWTVNGPFAGPVIVLVNNSQDFTAFSRQLAGSEAANWIGSSGDCFELYSNATFLDEVCVSYPSGFRPRRALGNVRRSAILPSRHA
jgi:hypothetical protein